MRCEWLVSLALVAAIVGGFAGESRADTDYFGGDEKKGEVTFRVERSRTTKQRVVIAALTGGAVLFGGAGVWFHLDSRDVASELEAVGEHTGLPWTQSLADRRDRGQRSKTLAAVGYAVGGAFLVSAVVALVMTEPGSDTIGVKSVPAKKATIPVSVAPVRGGAMVGKAWQF